MLDNPTIIGAIILLSPLWIPLALLGLFRQRRYNQVRNVYTPTEPMRGGEGEQS